MNQEAICWFQLYVLSKVLVKQLPESGIQTPKFLGRQEEGLKMVLQISNPVIRSWTFKTLNRFGSSFRNKKMKPLWGWELAL
jgi:hypothetical protein